MAGTRSSESALPRREILHPECAHGVITTTIAAAVPPDKAKTSTPTNPLDRPEFTKTEAVVVDVKATPQELIYNMYPRKEGCAKAKIAIQKALKKVSFADLSEAVQAYAASPAGQRGQFVPHPATWFNQERWNDDRAQWERQEDRGDPWRNTPVVHGYVSGTIRKDIADALAADAKRQAEAALATGPDPGNGEVFEPPY